MIREFEGPAGRLEALLDTPAGVPSGGRLHAAVVLAHPHPVYGGTMHTKVVYQTAKALARVGCAVVRFNFRGAGRSEGTFDQGVGELADFRAALDFAASQYPDVPELWAAGASFGAAIALRAGATDSRVTALVGIATPVEHHDYSALIRSATPKFFIHGEFDGTCPLRAVRELYAQLAEPRELVVIDAADHLFNGKLSEVAEAVEDLLGDFHGVRT